MQPRKAIHVVALSAAAVFVILTVFLLRTETIQNFPLPALFSETIPDVSRLHVLIVATSSNIDLCRLLLSLSVLSYPQPVLIDWEGEGEYNASDTHLAKITGTLRYLKTLPPSKQNDMVLMLDGYDIFMQLGPDVLLQRYFETTAAADARLKQQFGPGYVTRHGMYDGIVFGPDKMCWPPDPRRPACWAVPDSTLGPNTFGPDTDKFADPQLARPRWLNSGTIMGTASNIRELFEGTLEKVNKTWNPDNILNTSDQLYFADLWADQEYVRMASRLGEPNVPTPTAVPTTLPGIGVSPDFPDIKKEKIFVPDLKTVSTKDFHIGLDYESRMFQTIAYYENFIGWVKFNESETFFQSKKVERRRLRMQEDIMESRKPFAAIQNDTKLSNTSWKNTTVGVNVATGYVFPILHFTGDKSYRDLWWPQMWYFPYAERLLRASAGENQFLIGEQPINGTIWEKDVPYAINRTDQEMGVGAWVDRGEHMPWKDLCGKHERMLFSGRSPPRPPPPS